MAKAVEQAAEIREEWEALRESLQVKAPDEVVEYINLLVYGESGAGKTTLVGSAHEDERLRPLLIFDVEGGMTTLRKQRGIDVVSVRSLAQLEAGYNKLFHSIKDGKLYYKTVGIDPLTELADLDMRLLMKAAYSNNPDKVDIDVPSPREWGKVRNHIRLIVRGFRDLPCHVIFTATLGIERNENQPDKYMPGFAGKLVREVPGFADIVGMLSIANTEGVRKLQVQGTNRVIAKDRTKMLGGIVMEPSLSKIWDMIEGVPLPTEKLDAEGVPLIENYAAEIEVAVAKAANTEAATNDNEAASEEKGTDK